MSRVRGDDLVRARSTPVTECFGPLEVGYDFADVTRAADRGRPADIWRYRALLPVPADVATQPNTRARASPGWSRADNLARELGVKTPVGQGRLRQPDALVQGPGRRRRAGRRPRARLHRCSPAPRPATSPTPSPPRPRAPASGPSSSSPQTSSSRRSSPRRCTAARWSPSRAPTTTCNRLASRDRRRAGGLGVRQRQRPAVLRRGLEDAGLRGRRAARLAAARAGRHPGRARARSWPRSTRASGELGRPRAGRARRRTGSSAPRRTGCSPVAAAFRAGHDVVRPVRPDTIAKSLAIGNPADGPTCSMSRGGRAVPSRTSPTRRSCDGHPAAGADRGHLRRDRGRRDRGGAREAAARPEQLDPDAETVVFNTGDGLKTLDAIADRVGPGGDHPDPTYAVPRRPACERAHQTGARMSVNVRVPTILRTYTGGESEGSAPRAATAGRRARRRWTRTYPGIGAAIVDEQGRCAGSSTCTSATTTYVSATGCRPRVRRRPGLGDPRGRRRLTAAATGLRRGAPPLAWCARHAFRDTC